MTDPTIKKLRAKEAQIKKPPRCDLPSTNRKLWRRQDVEAWLATHIVTPPLKTR